LQWAKEPKQSTSGTPTRWTPNRHYGFAFPCHLDASNFKIERPNRGCLGKQRVAARTPRCCGNVYENKALIRRIRECN
jgi:hypothetical protein